MIHEEREDGRGAGTNGQDGQVTNPGQGGGGTESASPNLGQGGGGGAGRTPGQGAEGQDSDDNNSGGQEQRGAS